MVLPVDPRLITDPFTKPVSAFKLARGAAVGAGKGALAVGKGAFKLAGRSAALIPTAAGVLSSKMAGGDVAAGADPIMFARALGEGYAQRAPTWMGGLTDTELAAARSQGAGDIEGRFGAMPSATSAPVVARRPTAGPDMSLANELYNQDTQARPAPGSLAPVAPLTAADIRGTGVPPSGTGAFVNNRTGAVTNLDTRQPATAGGVAPRMVSASEYDAMRGAAPHPRSTGNDSDMSVTGGRMGGFFGPLMNLKKLTGDTRTRLAEEQIGADIAKARAGLGVTLRGQDLTAQTAAQRLGVDAALKRPGAEKDAATADRESLQAEMAREYLKSNPGDYAGAAGIASGRPLQTDKFGAIPSMTGNDLITYNKNTGASRIQTPIRPVSEADIQTTMKNNKMTREQVIARLKAEGKM